MPKDDSTFDMECIKAVWKKNDFMFTKRGWICQIVTEMNEKLIIFVYHFNISMDFVISKINIYYTIIANLNYEIIVEIKRLKSGILLKDKSDEYSALKCIKLI